VSYLGASRKPLIQLGGKFCMTALLNLF